MPNLPYKVIGTYHPSVWKAWRIGRDLTNLTHDLGLIPHYDPAHGPLNLTGRNWVSHLLHAEVRRRTFKATQAEGWHWDADLEPNGNPNCAIVCWASNNSTQIKFRNSDVVFQAKPYEVVIFRNDTTVHRRPPNCPRIRWMFRQRVQIPKGLL